MAEICEKNLVEKLKSKDTSEIFYSLRKIRTCYTRNISKVRRLQKYSLIESVIPFLEHPKFCNISLSIIADICLELDFVEEIVKLNGVKPLIRIMKSFVNDDVKNRACRALGNIAKFDLGFKAINVYNPVSLTINFLKETVDSNCQITAVRTLMILEKSPQTKEIYANENIVYIAKLLHSSNTDVLACSIKALASLTKNCSSVCARQLLELDFLKLIVELHSHSVKAIQDHALVSLRNLSMFEEVRGGLIKVGAVKLFVDILSKLEKHENSCLAACALCNCLDHIHMWSHNGTERTVGLKALLTILQDETFHKIHMHVISSLIPLSYESKLSDILLNLNFLPVLIQILHVYVQKHKCEEVIPLSNEGPVGKGTFIFSMLSSNKNSKNEFEINFDEREELLLSDANNGFKIKNSCNEIMTNSVSQNTVPDAFNAQLDNASSFRSYRYSNTYSPSQICSPIRKLCTSPELDSGFDGSSPSHSSNCSWSPISNSSQNTPVARTWSPISSCSTSSSPEKEIFWFEPSSSISPNLSLSPEREIRLNKEFETESNFPLQENFHDTVDKNGNFIENNASPINNVQSLSLFSNSKTDEFENSNKVRVANNSAINSNSIDSQDSRKRLKIEMSEKDKYSDSYLFHNKNQSVSLNNDTAYTSKYCPCKNNILFDASNKCVDVKTIDHHIILLLLQLSFHLKKKPNSQIADKTCFTVLLDYLSFTHYPNPKAALILFNLMKNRYCFEKLVINGFVSEIEDRVRLNFCFCRHFSNFKSFYFKLIDKAKKEAGSDYGIGTLSHMLVTSERKFQLQAICAASKLVTEKSALYRILFQAKGMPLLLSFLSDDSVTIRRKAIIYLCELYQSVTKEKEDEKCCIGGTCSLETSKMCFYKNTFLDITFLLDNGEKILANREKLCENSEYFNALLRGHFSETNAERVFLSEISADNLSAIFHFLHGCGSETCCPYIEKLSFSVLLELLSTCDRFLLMNIKAFAEDRLCHQLQITNIPKIYLKSKVYNSPELSNRALHFALSMDLSLLHEKRVKNCFEELIGLEKKLNFLNDIENLFKSSF